MPSHRTRATLLLEVRRRTLRGIERRRHGLHALIGTVALVLVGLAAMALSDGPDPRQRPLSSTQLARS